MAFGNHFSQSSANPAGASTNKPMLSIKCPNEEIKVVTNEDFLVEINSKQGTYKITGRGAEEFPEKDKAETKKTEANPNNQTISSVKSSFLK